MTDLRSHPIIVQYIEWNNFGRLLGMDFDIPKVGQVVYHMVISEQHLATPGVSHGGTIAALADAGLGVAALSKVCESFHIVSTVTLNVNYLHPACLGDTLTMEAEVIKAGKRILFVEGKISNQHGEIVASASATMNAYPLTKLNHK